MSNHALSARYTETPYFDPIVDLHSLESQVDVWKAEISLQLEDIDWLYERLSNEERKRSDKYYFIQDRHRYILGHAMLRIILGYYLSVPPEQLAFGSNKFGKPYLSMSYFENEKVNFNISHAGDIVAIAITRMGEVGIDVERIREFNNSDQFVKRIFAKSEISDFQSLKRSDKNEAFFNCWTRKEAFIKALGTGLSFPLDRFSTTIKPCQKACLLQIDDPSIKVSDWSMIVFKPRHGYAGALVVKAQNPIVAYPSWNLIKEHYLESMVINQQKSVGF